MKKFSNEEIQYILNNPKKSARELGREFNCSHSTISNLRKKHGLVTNNYLTESEIGYIIQNSDKTSTILAQELNRPASTIRAVWQRHGIIKQVNFNPNLEIFIEDYNKLKSSRKMAEKYGVSKDIILNFANKHNIRPTRKPWESIINDEEIIQQICEDYQNMTITAIAQNYNVSTQTIKKILLDNNVKVQKNIYHLNHDYFEVINTSAKAYFLGFIAADGCIYARKNGGQKWLQIGIHEQDVEILLLLLQELKCTKPIISSTNNFGTPVKTLTIVSDKICSDLSQYGIVERKTWIYKPQNIPSQFLPDFLRGYLDGDGYIGELDPNCPSATNVNFVGNEETMNWIFNIIKSWGIEGIIVSQDKRDKYSNPFFNLSCTNIKSKYCLLKILYGKANIFQLSRKAERAKNFINAIESGVSIKTNVSKEAVEYYNAVLESNF